MQFKDIHTLINMQPIVQILEQSTDDRSNKPNNSSHPNTNISCSRSNTHQSSNSPLACTHNTKLPAMLEIIHQNPTKHASASGSVGVESGEHCSNSGIKCTTTIKPEPAEPNETSSEEDESRVVGFAVGFVAVYLALSENKCVRQRGPS